MSYGAMWALFTVVEHNIELLGIQLDVMDNGRNVCGPATWDYSAHTAFRYQYDFIH